MITTETFISMVEENYGLSPVRHSSMDTGFHIHYLIDDVVFSVSLHHFSETHAVIEVNGHQNRTLHFPEVYHLLGSKIAHDLKALVETKGTSPILSASIIQDFKGYAHRCQKGVVLDYADQLSNIISTISTKAVALNPLPLTIFGQDGLHLFKRLCEKKVAKKDHFNNTASSIFLKRVEKTQENFELINQKLIALGYSTSAGLF